MNSRAVLVVFVVALAAGVGGYFIGRAGKGHEAEATTQEAKEPVVVSVKVAPLERKTIATTVGAYGTISALPEKLVVLSAQFDGTVEKLDVTLGQRVKKGDAIAEVSPSPETILAVREAGQNAEAADRDLKLVQQRYEMKLATAQELSTAEAALRAANLKKESFAQRHAGERAVLQATSGGVVAKIDLQQGQAAPSGAGIVEILPGGQAVARVGVDAASAALLHAGQKATVVPVAGGKQSVEGVIEVLGQRVNPETRLIEVLISLPADSMIPVDAAVRAEIQIGQRQGLLVPRDAALPAEEGKFELFTAKDGKAAKHEVKLGEQTGDQVEVIGEDLKEGEAVVIQGNYQLEDGMQVKVEGEAPDTTQPATQSTTKETP
jgi:membrane fusion protein (multidrug efflux system)